MTLSNGIADNHSALKIKIMINGRITAPKGITEPGGTIVVSGLA